MILAVGYLLVNWIINLQTESVYQGYLPTSSQKFLKAQRTGILLKDLAVIVIVFRETTRPVRANDHQSFTIV